MSKLRLAWSIWLHPQVRFAEDPLARGTYIFVKGVTSRQLQLFTSLSTPADVVSQALAQRVNGPAPMLKSGGHYLNGARPLSSYHVRSGDTIETSLGLRGGMESPSTGAPASAAGDAAEGEASLQSPAGSASGLPSGLAQSVMGAIERIKQSGRPVTKQDVHGYTITYHPQISGENGAKGKQASWYIKPPGSSTPIRSMVKLEEHLGLRSSTSPSLEQQQQQTQVPKPSPPDFQRQESLRDALVICHADDYETIEGALGELFATRMQASEVRELLNLIATKFTMRGAATDASYAGFYESLKPSIEDMIDAATAEYKKAVDVRNTMQQSFQSNPRLEEVWNTLPEKKHLDDLKAPPPEVDSITLEEASQSSSWPAADTTERAVRRILAANGEPIGVVVICKLPTPDDEDTVLDDDPPPPVRVKAKWTIEGESFSVELNGIFGLPPMDDDADALSKAINELFTSLQNAFEDIDQAEPRPLEGCKIKSCNIHHAKNTDGRMTMKDTETGEPKPIVLKREMSAHMKQQLDLFSGGILEGKPLATLEISIEGVATLTQPGVDEGQTRPRPDAPPIFPKQREVGDRIFARAQEVLGDDAWSSFKAVEFLVVTANFTTIREQTMERLSEYGLEDGKKKVVFTYLKQKGNLESCVWKSNRLLSQRFSNIVASLCRYEEFRNRALSDESTLFIVVADECHWGITLDGSARIYPNPTPKFPSVYRDL